MKRPATRGAGRRPRHARRWLGPGHRGPAVALLVAAFGPGGLTAQQPSAELRQLETQLDDARAAAVHLLAPRAFEEADERFAEAARRFDAGRVDQGLQDLLAEAHNRLGEAERIARAARVLMSGPLAGRAAAVAAEAEMRASQTWQRAEAELAEAGRRFERGDQSGAVERAGRAGVLYERAERAGWRDRLLGEAAQARAAAMAAGATELASEAFSEGESLLAAGEAEIEAGRHGDRAAAAGQGALGAFRRAARIAALADSVRRRTVSVERLVAAHEADLGAIAEAAGVEARSGETAGTTARISAEVRRLQRENRRLEDELAAARAEAARLDDRVANLEERLAEAELRFEAARGELLALREREQRLREVEGLFTPAEGEVLFSGDEIVLRLFGLTFESGSAEIDEAHYPLLTKVQRVITTFAGARVRIEGHTDSQGRDDANRALSQQRANAVREHLLARVPIPSSRVEAVGLGEDRPIGTNDTEEGRARNRRIEVVITVPGG